MRELWFCKKRWIFLLLRIAASKSDIFHKIYIPPLCINCTCWQSHSSWMILQDTKPFPPVDSQTSAAQQYHRFLPRSEELKHVHQWWSTVTRCNIFTCVSWGKVVDLDACRGWTSMIQTKRNWIAENDDNILLSKWSICNVWGRCWKVSCNGDSH